MGFEIAGLNYDPSRKLQRLGRFKAVRSDRNDVMLKLSIQSCAL